MGSQNGRGVVPGGRRNGKSRSGLFSRRRHTTWWARKRRNAIAALLSGVTATVVVAAALVSGGVSAQAATTGAGIQVGTAYDGSQMPPWIGNFITSNGDRVYCGNINASLPAGTNQVGLAESTNIQGVSGLQLARVNWVLWNYGQTADNNQAAATQIAVWDLLGQGSADGSSLYHGVTISGLLYNYAGSAARDSILSTAQSYVAAANANASLAPTTSNGSAPANPTVITNGNLSHYAGTVTVPTGYTTLRLTNAVWTATGSTTITVPGDIYANGGSLDWTGVPPDGVNTYTVLVQGDYSIGSSSTGVYETVLAAATPGEQVLIQGHQQTIGTVLKGTSGNSASDPLSVRFSPVVSTEVSSKIVEVGQTFSDQVTVSAAPINASDPDNTQEWRQWLTGAYATVNATATIYGPYLQEPTESSTVPSNAPVAGTATVSTGTTGPGTYTATSTSASLETGYYVWVWTIQASDQPSATQNYGIPDSYSFTDHFGQTVESSVTPARVGFVSQVSGPTVAIGGTFTDKLSISAMSNWLYAADGTRIPVTLTGKTYYTTSSPVESATVPSDATLVSTTTATATAPNTTVTSDTISAGYSAGWLTTQWCLAAEDQPTEYQGFFASTCDDYGIPAETVQVLVPTVSTQAQAVTTLPSTGADVATVGGTIPENGTTTISWNLYKAADNSSSSASASPSASASSSASASASAQASTATPVCDAATKVASGGSQTVTATGTYTSDPYTYADYGTYYWQETLVYIPAGSSTSYTLDTGKCGESSETVTVEKPTVVTTASVSDTALSNSISDTIKVSGVVESGSYITVAAYKYDTDQTCSTSLWTSAKVSVDAAGDYVTSDSYTPTEPGTYTFIETLYDAQGNVITTGKCGDEGETFTVHTPVVTTKASTQESTLGSSVHDTVTLADSVAEGSYVVVNGYKTSTDQSCSASVWASDKISVQNVGDYVTSDSYTPTEPGTYTFIETLYDAQGTVLATGKCGESAETFTIAAPLAETTASTTSPWLIGDGLGLLILGLTALTGAAIIRRRSRHTVTR